MSNVTRILFIVGASRSGTTMLNRVLGQNTEILALNELHYFGDLCDPYDSDTRWNYDRALKTAEIVFQRILHSIFSGKPESQAIQYAKQTVDALFSEDASGEIKPAYLYEIILDAVARESNAKMVTDQTPRNIFYADRLLDLYPDCRVIQIVRDPRAVLYSQRKRWSKKKRGAKDMPFSNVLRVFVNYHPITMARMWKRAVNLGGGLSKSSRYHQMSFEKLVQNPQRELKKLSAFLEVEYQKEMLDIPQIGSSHKRHDENIRGISSDYTSDWRSKLPKGDLLIVERITAQQMQKYDYQPVSDFWCYPWLLLPIIRLPFHVLGVVLTNPKRAIIQLKALLANDRKPVRQ